jgi:hypothetical protein
MSDLLSASIVPTFWARFAREGIFPTVARRAQAPRRGPRKEEEQTQKAQYTRFFGGIDGTSLVRVLACTGR